MGDHASKGATSGHDARRAQKEPKVLLERPRLQEDLNPSLPQRPFCRIDTRIAAVLKHEPNAGGLLAVHGREVVGKRRLTISWIRGPCLPEDVAGPKMKDEILSRYPSIGFTKTRYKERPYTFGENAGHLGGG